MPCTAIACGDRLIDTALYYNNQEAVDDGIFRSIGISNYYTPQEFDEITKGHHILPAVIQNERHLSYQDNTLRDYVQQYGTVMEGWYPLGGREHVRENLSIRERDTRTGEKCRMAKHLSMENKRTA